MQLLFAGSYDDMDNAWAAPTRVTVGTGVGPVATTGSFFSGPNGCVINEVYYVARDLTFTDPGVGKNVFIGLRIRYSADGGVTFTTVAPTPIWASADCPQLWKDSDNTIVDFVLDAPVRAFSYYGAGTGGLNAGNFIPDGRIIIPAQVHVSIEVAPVEAEALVDIATADFDTFDVFVYGELKG